MMRIARMSRPFSSLGDTLVLIMLRVASRSRFLTNRRGTPSIETVLLIALIALAISPMLRTLGTAIGQVFQNLTTNLNTNIGL